MLSVALVMSKENCCIDVYMYVSFLPTVTNSLKFLSIWLASGLLECIVVVIVMVGWGRRDIVKAFLKPFTSRYRSHDNKP